MRHPRFTTIALSATIGLLTAAPADAIDRLYKRDVEAAAAEIVWGNRAEPDHAREVLAIDPPLPRLGPDEPRVEVLALFRYDIGRSYRGPLTPWARNAYELLDRWQASLPPDVNVIRVPIAVPELPNGGWNWNWEFAARTHLRMLLTGRAIGIEDETHQSLLDALDADAQAFRFPVHTGVRATPESIQGLRDDARTHFQTKLGIAPELFRETWDSEAVTSQMRRSMTAYDQAWTTSNRHHRMGSPERRNVPPILLINGKHIVAIYNVKRPRRVFELANETIARELASDPARAASAEEQRWQALYRELRLVRPHDIAYDQAQSRAHGRVVEIDPPLTTAAGENALEIEWFFTYLHRGHDATRTTGWLTGRLENLLVRWIDTVPEADFARLRGRFTPVTTIPGHPGTRPEHARMLQELSLGHGYSTSAKPGEHRPTHIDFPVHRAIRRHFGYYTPPESLDHPREVKRLLKSQRLYTRKHRRVAKSADPRRPGGRRERKVCDAPRKGQEDRAGGAGSARLPDSAHRRAIPGHRSAGRRLHQRGTTRQPGHPRTPRRARLVTPAPSQPPTRPNAGYAFANTVLPEKTSFKWLSPPPTRQAPYAVSTRQRP